MESVALKSIAVEQTEVVSRYLNRSVTVDFYLPNAVADPTSLSLLLLNDGQDLVKLNFAALLDSLLESGAVQPVLCVGIHAGAERKMEYGIANQPDYAGRGAKAGLYQQFILAELLPYLQATYKIPHFFKTAFAGFSLGGLLALDAAWRNPDRFAIAAVFSGSLWWRSKSLDDGYNEERDRIMHQEIRNGNYKKGQRFYFTTGSLDETSDRNNNGIIDSIDDTLALIAELKKKQVPDTAICYINYEDGRHDVETWGRALPHFLAWAFEKV